VQLVVTGAEAASVSIAEILPGQPGGRPIAVVATKDGGASVSSGIPWLCDRLTRTFEVSETLPGEEPKSATTSVSTPACTRRISASVQANRVHRGYPLTIRLVDRWRVGGLRVQACLGGHGSAHCGEVTLKPGRAATLLKLRADAQGRAVVEVKDSYQEVRLGVLVLPSQPLLLATGDSEMQVLDELLASDLSGSGGARVHGDAHQSTAISSPFFFDWPAHAEAQVAAEHPDIVAMFLGGNEGFRLGRAECCGVDWSNAYAERVAGMMHSYLQRGAAAVYWFLIPTPSSEPFVRVVRAVNRGIIIAAGRFHEGVHVFDLRGVFSPGGHYIDSLTHEGRTITVHESDGFHLSASADVIVAHMFRAQLRHDGLLP
jgi:hypothetical protein